MFRSATSFCTPRWSGQLSIPIHRTVMIPFAVLRHLIAHEGELCRMGPLVGEQRAHAGKRCQSSPGILPNSEPLPYDLVVADRQHIMLSMRTPWRR